MHRSAHEPQDRRLTIGNAAALSLAKNGHHTLFLHRSQLEAASASRHGQWNIIGVDQSLSRDAGRDPPLLPNQRRRIDFDLYDTDPRHVDVCGDLIAVPSGDDCVLWSAQRNAWDICYKTPGGKIKALALSPDASAVWAGTEHGVLFSIDTATRHMTAIRHDAHQSQILLVSYKGESAITLDRDGVVIVWRRTPRDRAFVSLRDPGVRSQIPPKPHWCQQVGAELWVAYVHNERDPHSACSLVVYGFDSGDKIVSKGQQSFRLEGTKGMPSGAAIVPSDPNVVYLAHRSGHVSVWSRFTYQLVDIRAFSHPVTAILGPSRFLWVGLSTGEIFVFDVSRRSWKAIKRWQAHKGPVLKLTLDVGSLWSALSIRVVSTSHGALRLWDGLLTSDWVERRLVALESSYSTHSSLRFAFFTYNVGAAGPRHLETRRTAAYRSLLYDFLTSLRNPDVICFGFQEVIDLSNLGLAADIVLFASDNHEVSANYHKWRSTLSAAVARVLGPHYVMVTDAKLVGLYTCVFAKHEVKKSLNDLALKTVKAGFDAEYGNKGAIIATFRIADSSFAYINAHCAAGEGNEYKRERDLTLILNAKPTTDVTFFAGDLNPRITLPRLQVIEAVAKHNLSSLIEHEELTQKMKDASYPLSAYQEQALNFDPTYKYDLNTNEYDTSSKQRIPSWCDRILWKTAENSHVTPLHYRRYEADMSDHRPVSAAFECSIRHIDSVKHERARRQVLHEWAGEQERLLETCQDYYADSERK